MKLCLRVIAVFAAIASCSFASEEPLVFEYEPLDVQIFEGDDERVSFRCNASSNSNDSVYYRWYFRPPNGTFRRLADGESNEITVTKPSKANHGYYLCQAYNHRGSIQSRIAELFVLHASTIQFNIKASISVDWFALDVDGDKEEGSGGQSINVTDYRIIQAALEAALNSSDIRVKLDSVISRPGGSQVQVEIFSVCGDCNLLNYSLDTIENEVMNLYDNFSNLVEYLNDGIVNSEFTVVASSNDVIRMRVVMATAGNVSIMCPRTMRISNSHFFVCVNCAPGHYVRNSTCAPCELNHFQDQQGQTSCKQCPPSSFTNNMGTSSVEECILIGASSRSSEEEDDNNGGVIAGVVISVLFVVIVSAAVVVYMIYKGYRRKKKDDDKVPPPTIIIENSAVLPLPKLDDDSDDNLNEIPTIRYEQSPATSQSVKQSTSQSKPRKNHKSEKVTKRSQEVYKWNRSYSVAQVKNKYPNGSRIPSCYPIGEYVGSLSDNEGDMYDHVTSPSSTGKRRSMSISDLTSVLKEVPNYSLQVPSNFLSSLHAKRDNLHRLNSKPKSSPPAIEMDDDMTDLYDGTLRSGGRDRSNTLPSHESSDVRLSGMAFSLSGQKNGSESATKTTKRDSSKSVTSARPVTQYVNNEIVEQHRESMASDAADTASRVQSPAQERTIQFREAQEEPTYVTMRPAKLSLPNLESYFTQPERPPMTKPLSQHDNPFDIEPPIELVGLDIQPRRNSIDIDHVISDSEA